MAPSPYDRSYWWDFKHKHNNNNKEEITEALQGCAGWSAPLLFANPEDRFSPVEALVISNLEACVISTKMGTQW